MLLFVRSSVCHTLRLLLPVESQKKGVRVLLHTLPSEERDPETKQKGMQRGVGAIFLLS